MKTTSKRIQFGFHINSKIHLAVEVHLSRANLYGLYFPERNESHFSYHQKGELHFQKKGKYLQWTGGNSGDWEDMRLRRTPPKEVSDREDISMAWETDKMESVLPAYDPASGKEVHAFEIPDPSKFSAVGLIVSVIGSAAAERQDHVGFPIFDRHQFTNGILTAEVEAFGVPHSIEFDLRHDDLDYGLD
jgi:hypothetical protein